MKFEIYGPPDKPVIVLLHGGGLGPWNYGAEAELLRDRFRVVLPVLDGHSGSDREFTTLEDAADGLITLIDEQFGGQVLLLGGLSLGGQILTEALSRRGDLCRCALIESALAVPMPLTAALAGPSAAMSWPLVKKRWFAKAQFASLHMDPVYFEDYFRDSAAISRQSMTAFLKANADYRIKDSLSRCSARTLVAAGSRELAVIRRSAGLLGRAIPGAEVEILPGFRHGELSINHPGLYIQKLLRLIGDTVPTVPAGG